MRIVCFGALLIRLSAPGRETLLQTPELRVHVGGAEMNVAVSLAQFGVWSAAVSIVPDNALGRAAVGELRRYGADTSLMATHAGRMGLYFLSPGAIHRPSQVLYDRADSSFALAPADLIDWSPAFNGASWLHLSGITPAISANAAAAALRAAKTAKQAGVKISFDGNYRASLWGARAGEAPAILRALFAEADLVFADHRDIALITGKAAEGDEHEQRRHAAATAFATFPNLQRIACTGRRVHSVDHNDISGFMFTRDGVWTTRDHALPHIVDRIGGGDAFAAGVLYGLEKRLGDQEMLDFAIAAACLKHSIPGDFNLVTIADVQAFLSENKFDVRR
ncbi:MAG: sugar kinase [Pseudomonadota bacterium]